MRVPSQDKYCVEADIGRVRYKAKNGYFEMPDNHAKLWLKATGEHVYEYGADNRSTGYRCTKCGFGSWFKKCSKCGGICGRET